MLWPLQRLRFDWIFFILAGNKKIHKSLDEFEFKAEPALAFGVKYLMLSPRWAIVAHWATCWFDLFILAGNKENHKSLDKC